MGPINLLNLKSKNRIKLSWQYPKQKQLKTRNFNFKTSFYQNVLPHLTSNRFAGALFGKMGINGFQLFNTSFPDAEIPIRYVTSVDRVPFQEAMSFQNIFRGEPMLDDTPENSRPMNMFGSSGAKKR